MKRRALSMSLWVALLAAAVMLLAAGPAAAWDGTTAETKWSGTGTSADPYVIGSAADLKGLANTVNTGTSHSGEHFRLSGNIDLENYVWVPIGGACTLVDGVPTGNHFDGIFDGANHTVSGINVSNPAAGTGAYGLFGYVGTGGILANLSVAGSLNMGTLKIDEIGAVVGYCRGSLYNVHSSMSVYMNDTSYTASMCGGIAGVVENTSSSGTQYVRYCSNTGPVTGRGRIGGIVGAVYCVSNGGVVVDQCYNTGYLTSTYSASKIFTGGIAGYCRGYITDCYNQGNLETNNGHYLAGIVGLLQGASPVASMSDCYSTAVFIKYASSHDRWLYGSSDYSADVHITNCFWLPNSSNTDITQPYDPSGSWGTQTNMSSVTAAQLEGTADMTGCEPNDSGVFSGSMIPDYLGAADPDNAGGSYGWAYAAGGGYPVLDWQLMSDFYVDPATGFPPPPTSYSVAASVVGGNGTATADPVSVASGGSSTITLAPADGYWLQSITDNGADVLGSVVDNTYAITAISENHTVVATFFNGRYTLTYTAGAHGQVSGTSPQSVVQGENGAAVTAVANAGFHFAGWTDGSTANPRVDSNVRADIEVTAIFLPDSGSATRPGDHFTIAVIPDTQFYSAEHPGIFDQQTQWVADNAASRNIVFQVHLGDLVDTYNSTAQWQNARDSMSITRAAGIPYSVVPGNHDLYPATDDLSYFNTYFPYTDFAGYSWYNGHYPADGNSSSYQLFTAMGQKFVVLNLIGDKTLLAAATTWANSVLTEYSDRQAIVVTHGYIHADGTYTDTENAAGLDIWNNIVSGHSNVIAVLCGHWDGEYWGTNTGTGGNTVYNLLTDYQDDPNGGNGWLRLYEFYPLEDEIRAVTYSPYLDQYQTDADSQFTLALEQDSYAVTFESDGATYTSVVAASGSQIEAPADPVKSGYTFGGWCSDAALTNPVVFPYTVSGNAVLYAKWNAVAASVKLSPGWNLIAAGSGTTFPTTLFGWNGSSYESTTSPVAWQGYWCRVGEEQTVQISTVAGPHTTGLTAGWNLIGNPMSSTASLTLPAGRVAFAYDATARTYVSTTTLAPGQGAWVRGSAGETVVFQEAK